MGSVSAPVVVAEWGDFQCPFCRAFALDSEPVLIADYVQTGKVRFEWHDLAKLGPESVLAARGARAAARQGAFWVFHDAFYRDQAPENSGAVTEQSLIAMARGAGLDVDRFVADMGDPAVADAVERDRSDARQLGITHVPSFLVNDELLIGAQSLDTLRQVIDAALVKAS
ncbi:DsbA family protein [Mycolicibacterium cosmeticum]|uniref:DsbA family protein n=2 Tax=Mycobacteriaceae TaxID=1762 RepID=UPI003204888E